MMAKLERMLPFLYQVITSKLLAKHVQIQGRNTKPAHYVVSDLILLTSMLERWDLCRYHQVK